MASSVKTRVFKNVIEDLQPPPPPNIGQPLYNGQSRILRIRERTKSPERPLFKGSTRILYLIPRFGSDNKTL